MQEETTTSSDESETQTSDTSTETVSNQQTSETPESTESTTQTQASLDDIRKEMERLKASLKRANAEAKTEREKAAELAKFKEQVDAEKLSEQQRQELARQNLEKQLAETRAQLTEKERLAQERIVNYEVRLQAAAAGVNPKHLDKVAKLLDRTDFQFDESSGEPTNVKDLLATLVKDMPELLVQERKATPSSGGATNPPRSQTSTPSQLSWEVIGKMTSAQYEARRAEIQQWMSDPKNQHGRRF